MDIQIINPITYPGWDEILLSAPDHSFFHSSSWAKVLSESYGYSPTYFTLLEGNKIIALIPVMEIKSFLTGKRGVSLPFTDYCDPIILNGVPFPDLFNCIIDYGQKHGWKYLELRGGQKFLSFQHLTLNTHLPCSSAYFGHTLDLAKGEEQILSGLRDSTQRNIRKAVKEGVKVEVANTLDSVKEFHRLNLMTRKRHGLPPQPLHFFEKVYEHIISKHLGIVVLASYENKVIAGAVFFHFGEKAVFKFGASDRNFHYLRPNNFVMWEAIKWYRANGFKSICFGRTEPVNIGLRRFKQGWGTEELAISYHKYDLTKDTFVTNNREISTFQKKMFSKMPVPILNIFGSIIYKHMG
jgi:hypothetical protein